MQNAASAAEMNAPNLILEVMFRILYCEAELGVQHYHSQPSPGIDLTCTLS